MKLEAIPLVVQHCRTVGPLSLSALNAHELQLLQNMLGRLCKVAQAAAEVRMCLQRRTPIPRREPPLCVAVS